MKCILIKTGDIGIIKNELSAGKTFPEQWGIYWLGNKITETNILPHYWQDKTKIKIIES